MGLPLKLVMKDYDYLAPLACGDVRVEDVDLTLVRDTAGALDITLADSSVHAGELSFSRHIHRLASSDHSFVGIPFFPARGFRHRCFYVRRDSGLRNFIDLARKRIGTNEWPASGNTWSRALLRDAGVNIEEIQWWVGPVDGAVSGRLQGTLPAHVKPIPAGQTLREMLIDGQLEALMCPNPPKGFYEKNSPIVRLIPDFRSAEQAYYQRTGISHIQHIVGVRRDVFVHAPWLARNLYMALEQAKVAWHARRRQLAETTPWLLSEIEEAALLFGGDWYPNGVEANRKNIDAFLKEQVAQRLVASAPSFDLLFAEFAKGVAL